MSAKTATAMKSEQAFTEANTPVFYPAMDIQVENTEESANFEYHLPAICEKKMKSCHALASASNVLITNKKQISSFVGPSKLYIVMKGMKIENTEVQIIAFLGRVPHLDIEQYMARRPNVSKVIMDSYGPISCTWSAFDGVRKSLTSFVVCSGDGFVDICDFLSL